MSTGHMTTEQVERYIKRLLPPSELLEVDDHLAECVTCREACVVYRHESLAQLGSLEGLSALQKSLAAETLTEPDHLTYEQLLAYIEGTLDDVNQEIASSHLESCPLCARERRDLAEYRTHCLADPSFLHPEAQKEEPPQKPRMGLRIITTSAQERQIVARVVQIVAGLAAASVLILLGYRFTSTGKHKQIGQKLSPPIAANVSKPSSEISLSRQLHPDRSTSSNANELRLASELRQARLQAQQQKQRERNLQTRLTLALRNQRNLRALASIPMSLSQGDIHIPRAEIQALRTGSESPLMGEESASGGLRVQAPAGEVVLSDQPDFHWAQAKESNSPSPIHYLVLVWDANHSEEHPLQASKPVTGTHWAPSQALPRERILQWRVKALQENTVVEEAPIQAARFRILDMRKAKDLAQLQIRAVRMQTVLARMYAEDGLLTQAQSTLTTVLQADPHNEEARKLLAKVRAILVPQPTAPLR